MRVVQDTDGDRYLLVDGDGDAAVVRDPVSGDLDEVPLADLETCDDASAPSALAEAVPVPDRSPLGDVRDEDALGLLVLLGATGPTAVEPLLDGTSLCESDLHGAASELRAAGLLDETTVGGRRGYRTTDEADAALDRLVD